MVGSSQQGNSQALVREAKIWLSVIAGLFVLLLAAGIYRFGGYGHPVPVAIAQPPPSPTATTIAESSDARYVHQSKLESTGTDNTAGEKRSVYTDSSLGVDLKYANSPMIHLKSPPDIKNEQDLQNSPSAVRPVESSEANRFENQRATGRLPTHTSFQPIASQPESLDDGFVNSAMSETKLLANSSPDINSTEEESNSTTSDRMLAVGEERELGVDTQPTVKNELRDGVIGGFYDPPKSRLPRELIQVPLPLVENSIVEIDPEPVHSSELGFQGMADRIGNSDAGNDVAQTKFENEIGYEESSPIYSVVARPGDSYWSVSQRVYGDGRLFRALHAVNRNKLGNNVGLEAGALVRTPPIRELIETQARLVPDDIKINQQLQSNRLPKDDSSTTPANR